MFCMFGCMFCIIVFSLHLDADDLVDQIRILNADKQLLDAKGPI